MSPPPLAEHPLADAQPGVWGQGSEDNNWKSKRHQERIRLLQGRIIFFYKIAQKHFFLKLRFTGTSTGPASHQWQDRIDCPHQVQEEGGL